MARRAFFYTKSNTGALSAVPDAQAIPVRFSALRCLDPQDEAARTLLRQVGKALTASAGRIAVYGGHESIGVLFELCPELRARLCCWVVDHAGQATCQYAHGLPAYGPDCLPQEVAVVYFNAPGFLKAKRMRERLRAGLRVVSPEQVAALNPECVPLRAWAEEVDCIYPLEVPEFEIPSGLDFLLLDCPAKNMGFMPNGLAYVHNALKKTGLNFCTVDLDIIVYHRFHTRRLLDAPERLLTPQGELVPDDPWLAENSRLWTQDDFLQLFQADLDEFYEVLRQATPKVVGFSVHEANTLCVRHLAQRLKQDLPEVLIVVGGYSCLVEQTAFAALPIADYIVVGEADETLGPLAESLARGERPYDLPGILSRFDSPGHVFAPAPPPKNLDTLDHPSYDWCDPNLYRNYNGYQLIPITISRGCRWSRCTFCTERFSWRTRSAKGVADELEYHYRQGGDLFLFNDSDFNGARDVILGLCEEIRHRELCIRLTGQLRIDRRNTFEYWMKLKAAGFVSLHFGVDAWCKNSLVTACKGYNVGIILENLKACREANLFTEVNLIVGYPGETEADIAETIDNIIAAKPYIGRIAVINPLMMKTGSLFWGKSEAYGIRFKGNKLELAQRFPAGIPSNLWYSEEPYLDEDKRNDRVQQVVSALERNGIPLGGVAAARLKEMESGQDALRGGMRPSAVPVQTAGATAAPEAAFELLQAGAAHYTVSPVALRGLSQALEGAGEERVSVSQALERGALLLCEAVDSNAIFLVSEGMRGYNIIQVGRRYAALRQGIPFDPQKFALNGYGPEECIPGDSVVHVVTALQSVRTTR